MPLVSVILPVFNGERTIEETIKSVLTQTLKEFELIIIDDGSTDRTLEIIRQFFDPRIQIFSYPNAGQPASRNRGLQKASGDLVAFIDADDLWTPQKLMSQYQALQQNPTVAVAYSWTQWIDTDGKPIEGGSCLNFSGDVYENLLLNDFIASGSNPLIRRQAIDSVGVFDTSLSNAHDWDMWLRLAVSHKFVSIPEQQVLYRKSHNSMSANVWGMERSSLQVIQKNIKQLSPPESLIKKSIGNRYKYLMYRSLERPLIFSKGLAATYFLSKVITYDPAFVLKGRLLMIVCVKIIVSLLGLPKKLD